MHDGCDDADDQGRSPSIQAIQLELIGITTLNSSQWNGPHCAPENSGMAVYEASYINEKKNKGYEKNFDIIVTQSISQPLLHDT